MNVDDSTLKALLASLNMRQSRHELISSNIANSETPGFKAKRLDFENALARALDIEKENSLITGNKKHFNVGGGGFDTLQPELYEDPNGIVSEDGNTVDRDAEMALMAQNKILYDAAIQLMNKKFGLAKYILNNEN
ncbi:MAG: flagellar basal body rod protein FlgB [Bacteriovoracaceae bacterium]